jgi:hypothetical protein
MDMEPAIEQVLFKISLGDNIQHLGPAARQLIQSAQLDAGGRGDGISAVVGPVAVGVRHKSFQS